MTFRSTDETRKWLLEMGVPSGAAALALHLLTKDPGPMTIASEPIVDISSASAPVIPDEPHAHSEIEEPLASEAAAFAIGPASATSSGDPLSWQNNSQDVANEIARRRPFHPAYLGMESNCVPLLFEPARST